MVKDVVEKLCKEYNDKIKDLEKIEIEWTTIDEIDSYIASKLKSGSKEK